MARWSSSELVIPFGNTPFFGKFLDLDMLVCFGGMERAEREYISMLESAGFHERSVPVLGDSSALSLLVGRAVAR